MSATARWVLVVLAGAVALVPGVARAHTGLESSDPADGAVAEGPLEVVVLQFTGTPTAIDDGIAVADAAGDRYEPVEVVQDGLTISARFEPPLGDGSYALSWVVRSDDTHTVSGSFGFSVAVPATTTAPPVTTVPPTTVSSTSAPPTSVDSPTTAVPSTVGERDQVAVATTAPPSEPPPRAVAATAPVTAAASDIETGESVARIGRLILFPSAIVAVGALAFAAFVFAGRRSDLASIVRLVRWLGIAVAFGGVLEVVGLEPALGGFGEVAETGAGRAAIARIVGGVCLAVGVGPILGARSAPPVAPPTALSAAVLDDTAVAPVAAPARWYPARHPVAVVGVVLVVGSFAFDGHTVSEGPRAVHALASIAHVAAASAWAGGLVALAVVLWLRYRADVTSRAVEMVTRFSVVAMVALVLAGSAGLVMAWFVEDDLGAYTGSDWGRLMLAKLALVGVAVVLGGYNHFRVLPALTERPDDPAVLARTRATVTTEGVLLVAAALVTAVLVGASTI